MTTLPTSEELAALFNQDLLAGEMARRFGLKDKAQIHIVEARCAALHNAGTLDFLCFVGSDSFQGLSGSDFFTVMHFYCSIIPELEATPAQIMTCVDALVARGGGDLAANQPNAAFRIWCKKKSDRAREVIVAAQGGDDLASRYLTFALEAINGITEARQIALENDGVLRLSAITALGRIEDGDPVSRIETLAVFSALIDSGADDTLRANMLAATASILGRSLDAHSPESVALVTRLVEDANDNTLHQAAHMLWACMEVLEPGMVASLLQALERINPANKGTVRELDHGLEALLELGYDEEAIAFVAKLFSRRDCALEFNELESFTRTLVSGAPERLSSIVVDWLLLGSSRLCDGLANAIQGRGRGLEGLPLDLRTEHIDISAPTQLFLCRKAIGWFFFKPISAASVLVSVLRVCDADTALEVQKLLADPLLLNYSCVREYLEKISPDDAAKVRVDQAVVENKKYLAALKEIPFIKELQPSEHRRRIEQIRMSDQMRDVHKQAQSKSVFLSIVKRSVLLYGKHSLSFIKEGSGALRPMEMDLKPYSISFEMPRMENVDPVGLDYTLRVFRAERMES